VGGPGGRARAAAPKSGYQTVPDQSGSFESEAKSCGAAVDWPAATTMPAVAHSAARRINFPARITPILSMCESGHRNWMGRFVQAETFSTCS
jgi:hypothetical protein